MKQNETETMDKEEQKKSEPRNEEWAEEGSQKKKRAKEARVDGVLHALLSHLEGGGLGAVEGGVGSCFGSELIVELVE